MTFLTLINLAIFIGILFALWAAQKKQRSLSQRVFFGMLLGIGFGLYLHYTYRSNSEVIVDTMQWINLIGTSYVRLLKMIIMPLVLIMMISAVIKVKELSSLGKIGGTVITVLLGTTMVSALIGITFTWWFGLNTDGLLNGAAEITRAQTLNDRQASLEGLNIFDTIKNFVPKNIFEDLSGARATSIIGVVIIGILFGIATLLVMREKPNMRAPITNFIDTVQAIVMKLLQIIMSLTPFGIAALMTKVVAGANMDGISRLFVFIAASYLAIAAMFVVHATLLFIFGCNLKNYFRSTWPALSFAFGSRSSAATIPINVKTQIDHLKVPPSIANLSASLGSIIGQNGCAGIYPAMLATMIAPSVGIDPMSTNFIVSLVVIITVSSLGIAGVGGGATIAALVVLPAMGLPVSLAALLISIEPVIDMARTALNVNGAMTAGVITSRILNRINYESTSPLTAQQEQA